MRAPVSHELEFGPFRIDTDQRVLFRDRQPVPLPPKAFDLLLVLAQRSGHVVLKDELMSLLWPDTFVEESNIGQHVFQLRKVLGEGPEHTSYIATVAGRGYRFVSHVRTVPKLKDGAEEPGAAASAQVTTAVDDAHSTAAVPGAAAGETAAGPLRTGRLARRLAIGAAVLVVVLVAAVVIPRALPQPKVTRVVQVTHTGAVLPFGRVFSDGARLYFTERKGGTGVVGQVLAAGGEPSIVRTSIVDLTVLGIDPTRSKLLVGSISSDVDNPLWVVPTEGGSVEPVSDALVSETATWSPDGRRILYSHDTQIYGLEEGGEPVKLASAPGFVTTLRFSPDAKTVRFTVRSAAGGNSVWESAAAGGNPHRVDFGIKTSPRRWGEGESCGDWTPDGKYFVFRSVHGGVTTVWAVRENPDLLHRFSNAPVQLYTSPDHLGDPMFSPDGKKLYFVNYQERRELVRFDSVQKLFVPYLDGIPARALSFSPDHEWAAYRNDTDLSLWRSRVDGTEKLQLSFPPIEVMHSSWSPDGKRIVFEGHLPEERSKIFMISSSGGKPEEVIPGDDTGTGPSWSPDGRYILYQHWTLDESATPHSGVYLYDMTTRTGSMIPGSRDFDGVHWSPDGKYAAAADQIHHKLVLYDFAKHEWSDLADGTPYGWGIRWSRDSRYVYYQHFEQAAELPIFRVRVADRQVEQITSSRQILRADMLTYTMTGLTPENSPLASLVHRNSDIYVLELDLP